MELVREAAWWTLQVTFRLGLPVAVLFALGYMAHRRTRGWSLKSAATGKTGERR